LSRGLVSGGAGRFAGLLKTDRLALETVASNAVIAASVFGAGVVLARALGPTGRGQVAAHLAAIGASFALGGLGLNYGAAFAAARSGAAKRAFSNLLPLGLASLCATCVLTLVIEALAIGGPVSVQVGWAVAGAVAAQAASITSGWVQGSRATRAWNALRILQLGGYLPLVAVFLWFGALTVTTAVAAYSLSQMAAFGAGLLFAVRRFNGDAGSSSVSHREVRSYSSRVAVSAALYQVNQRWDQLVLAFLRRTEDLGVYASAVSLAGVSSALVAGLAQATYAEGLHADARARRRMGRRRILTAVLVASLCAILLSVFRTDLMRALYGPSFERGASALLILAWGSVFIAGNYVAAELLRSAGNSRAPMWADITAAVATLVGLPFAVLRFGILGAAGVSALVYLLTFAINFRSAMQLMRSSPPPDGAAEEDTGAGSEKESRVPALDGNDRWETHPLRRSLRCVECRSARPLSLEIVSTDQKRWRCDSCGRDYAHWEGMPLILERDSIAPLETYTEDRPMSFPRLKQAAPGLFRLLRGAVRAYSRLETLLTPRSPLEPAYQMKRLKRDLPEPGHRIVVDVGGGLAPYRTLLDGRSDTWVVLEKDRHHAGELRNNGGDADYLIGAAENIPLLDETCDLVVLTEVLEHCNRPADVLNEIARILRSGGLCVGTVPQYWHVHGWPSDYFRYTMNGLSFLAEQAGLDVVRMELVLRVPSLWTAWLLDRVFFSDPKKMTYPDTAGWAFLFRKGGRPEDAGKASRSASGGSAP
jgi:O-antigen/teichoic acid export membrane protein/SAM-dependent methyltransferase